MKIALAGLAALAMAMGIGRFAFTPLLPMMQQDAGLSLAQGGYLASANYVGYLVGALWAMRPALRGAMPGPPHALRLDGARIRSGSFSVMPHSASATSSGRPSSRRWHAISSPPRWCSAGHGPSSALLPRSPRSLRRAPITAA